MTYFDPKTYNEEKLNSTDKREIDFWRELFNKAWENAEGNYLESFESPDTAMTIIRKEILRVFRNHLIEHFEWSVKDYVISRLDSYAAENFRAEKSFLDFEQALHALKSGEKVTRAGWNGKGMYLFLIRGYEWDLDAVDVSLWGRVKAPFIVMKTADGTVTPWVASQTDMLADDWQIAR